ncbi:glutamyl-tRNA reductase [Xylanimonas sp. McL0601]|uniref:glutamyl-tRNA reductase n=1 Tax=Xylanimonas sp. McL0601 TaxID=3414739 RepID=UPI003CF2C6B8
MVLLSLTASHRELDLDALERLSTGSASVGRTVVGSCGPVHGAVVISTCNRFEVYLDVEAPINGPALRHATEHVAELVAAASGVSAATAADSFTVRTSSEVPEHLFAVASGLDSMVIGEREIAGQVKRALEVAREERTTSKTLELLFQTASRTSKRVGASTSLGSTGRSIVRLALDLAADALPEWRAVRTVLIGTGSYAGATVAALRGRGSDDVRVYSQSGRAQVFADGHDVVALGDDEESLVEALAEADLVVSVSGARGRAHAAAPQPGQSAAHRPQDSRGSDRSGEERAPEASLEFVLDAAAVARARVRVAERAAASAHAPGRRGVPRPLVVLDLALHRDVDPEVADVEGVLLYDLQALKAHVPSTARAVVEHAREIVDDAAREFAEHQVGRAADAAVVALLDDAERRARAEIDAAVGRLRDELAARGEVDALGRPAEPDEDDLEKIARDVRKRVHAALHGQIVAVRADAVARARAEERAIVTGAEATTAQAAAVEA